MGSSIKKGAHIYDVIVVGAGPAGCEAALASALAGARTLCLTINLDTAGFPPGSPLLFDDAHDKRGRLLDEMHIFGMVLPYILQLDNVCPPRGEAPGQAGQYLVDRRELGLSYKEQLESAAGLEFRQALVTSIDAIDYAWAVNTRLGERFTASSIVLAAGTFLEGKVIDGVRSVPGGRRGEIPSNALAVSLKRLGFQFQEDLVTSAPRLDGRSIAGVAVAEGAGHENLLADGSQLMEIYDAGFDPTADLEQGPASGVSCGPAAIAASIPATPAAAAAGISSAIKPWLTRNPYSVNHLLLQAGQLNHGLESPAHRGLFFAGRVAGCSAYIEAAVLGAVAGQNAGGRATGKAPAIPLDGLPLVSQLCEAVATQERRPVSLAGAVPDETS